MTIEALLDRLDVMQATIEAHPGEPLFDLGSHAAIEAIRGWAIELRDAPTLAQIERGAV
jgi:hypothetical protein